MTSGFSQSGPYSLTGLDTACSLGPGTASNSCALKLHSGTSCSANQGSEFYTGTVTSTPWGSSTYTSTSGAASGTISVTTGGVEKDITGRVFIVYAFDGTPISCAVLGVPEELAKLSAVPRAGRDNCHNLYAIKRGDMVAKEPKLHGRKDYEKVEILRSLPILNEHNCKQHYPVG